MFFPWIDMSNNDLEPNSMLMGGDDFVYLQALRPIAKGEEVGPTILVDRPRFLQLPVVTCTFKMRCRQEAGHESVAGNPS